MQRVALRPRSERGKPNFGSVRRDENGNVLNRGRKKGTPNGTTRVLKTAILMAAERVGEDGYGKLGLLGYLKRIAREEPKSFCALLGRVLPLQIQGDPQKPLRMLHEGATPQQAAQLYAETIRAIAAQPTLDVIAPRNAGMMLEGVEYREERHDDDVE